MKNVILFMIGIVHFITVDVNASTVRDTFTDEDKMFLAEYQLNDMEKPFEETAIRGFILNKLENGRDSQDTLNGLKMIYSLATDHKTHFDVHIISLLHREIQTAQTYFDYRLENGAFTRGLYALGNTRTELSVQYLMQLMEQVNNWQEEIRNPVLANEDRVRWEYETRRDAFGALLQPFDQKGVELFPELEEHINSFPENETKSFLLERIENWKKLYRERNLLPTQKTDVSDFEVLDEQQ